MTDTREGTGEAVAVVATFRPLPGAREDLLAIFRRFLPLVHAEQGCELYAIHDAGNDTIVMVEKWASRADLDAHSANPLVAEFAAELGPHLHAPAEITVLTPLLTELGPAATL